MKFIISNKVYDTDKMTLIAKVKKWYEVTDWLTVNVFGTGYGRVFDCKLFRSDKGNYLLTHDHSDGHIVGQAITEAEAKELILHCDYDTYEKLFGALEEA